MWLAPGAEERHSLTLALCLVGEEDEVSIREAAESVVEAMDFKGELIVFFYKCLL